jgi:hypothetical protein
MDLNLDDRAKLREASDAYKGTDLAKENNDYFEEKPYWVKHLSASQWAKSMTIVGHLLSILIGSICGYHLGKALFSGFDLVVWGTMTLGAVLGLSSVVLATAAWEVIKNKFLHHFFKEWYQFKRKYTNSKQWGKLTVLFGVSLVLSGYGGFEVVSRWFGDAQTSKTTIVDVDDKVQHLVASIARKDSTIAKWEGQQKELTDQGKEPMYRKEKAILALTAERGKTDSTLTAQRAFWDAHNITAEGNTDKGNSRIKEEHAGNRAWYALLFSLFAILADTLTLYCIRYAVRYKYLSHREMIGAEYFLKQAQARNHKMKVVHRAEKELDQTITKDATSPDVTIEEPQQTSPKNKTNTNGIDKTSGQTTVKKKHGECYWENGKAFMWYKLQTNGSIVPKNSGQLKALRNKALGRAEKAKTEEAKANNQKQAENYGNLFARLVDFQTTKQAI